MLIIKHQGTLEYRTLCSQEQPVNWVTLTSNNNAKFIKQTLEW
jgi:hypothetical protein